VKLHYFVGGIETMWHFVRGLGVAIAIYIDLLLLGY